MKNPGKSFDDLRHKRILEITRLLENGRAGLTKTGKIVDRRKYPGASKILMSPLEASRVLLRVSEMHVAR